MKYEVRLKTNAKKELSNLTKKDKDRIYKSFLALSHYPYFGKKLDDDFEGYYSIIIWPFRIIYRIYDNIKLINVVTINYRQGVYKH